MAMCQFSGGGERCSKITRSRRQSMSTSLTRSQPTMNGNPHQSMPPLPVRSSDATSAACSSAALHWGASSPS